METVTIVGKSEISDHDEGELLNPLSEREQRVMAAKAQRMSKRTLNWTSVKTPATSVGTALRKKVTGFETIESGINVTKITTRGKLVSRVITVSEDRFAIFVTHTPIHGGKGVVSSVANKLKFPLISRHGIRGLTDPRVLREQYVRYVDVADIEDIQAGFIGTQKLENARNENRLKGKLSDVDNRSAEIVSIIHHGNRTLDILVPNQQERKKLLDCIEKMRIVYHLYKRNVSNDALLLRYIWYDIDINRDGLIGENEFSKILTRINFYVKNPTKHYQKYLSALGKTSSSGLTYMETMNLLHAIKQEAKICFADELWNQIFDKDADVVDIHEFLVKFLHQTQDQRHMTLEDASEILTALNGIEINRSDESEIGSEEVSTKLSRTRFEVYLFNLMNSAYDSWALEMDGEVALDRPLSQYWINTSHNTYLTGDQLQSNSSVEMYMRALRRGSKCLELDCWDGEKTSEGIYLPIVFHGHTLTSKILFEDIIRGVKAYIQVNPDTYPIILSLENHCSRPFQITMAQIMEELFGDMLYRPPKRDADDNDLPSPEQLRGKVVIKGKRPPEAEDAPENIPTEIEDEEDPYADTTEVISPTSTTASPSKKGKKHKIVPELARLTLFHGTKYSAFEISILEPKSHMHSIGESKIGKILAKTPENVALWREYNTHHMTRTYPSGARVDSSNYNPMLAWATGCQLVALNFQTSDAPLVLNDGRFRQNHGCGYILKPTSVMGKLDGNGSLPLSRTITTRQVMYTKDTLDHVMEGFEDIVCGDVGSTHNYPLKRAFSSNVPLVKERSVMVSGGPQLKRVVLKIRVLAGSCLPKPKGEKVGETIDPYVTVSVHDVNQEDGKFEHVHTSNKTASINDNGFCPVWWGSFHEYPVHSPDVAMLHVCLKEKDVALDDKVGEACIPINCLRTGYRSVQIFDDNGTNTGPFGFATLLLEIQRYDM